MSPGQVVGDVRTLVARRVGAQRRVVFLGSDAALVKSIQNNGCEVLVDPASLEEAAAFGADVVVAFDGFALEHGRGAFEMLASTMPPSAEVVFSFANAGSASAALTALTGSTPIRALAERDVTQWLRSAGYVVTSRDVVVVPHAPSGLSADTESALRQLFEQLNPDAAADRFLLVAKRGVAASMVDRTEGLLSVVVSSGGSTLDPALEGTVASLLSQQQRPMELIVASPLPLEQTDRLLNNARIRSGISCVLVTSRATDWAARTNAGIAVATGQYLACVEAGDAFAPFAFSSLVKRLDQGTRAWALGASRVDLPTSFSLAAWLEHGAVQRQAYVVDRNRVGQFPLSFAEGVEGAEAMRFARLAALFEPSWVPGELAFEGVAPAETGLDSVLTAMRPRPLRILTTLAEALKPAPRLRDLLNDRVRSLLSR